MATQNETVEFILGKLRDARVIVAILALSLLFLAGCSRSAEKAKANDVLVSWLESHGETNIVQDKAGVGIAGNATRLGVSLYGSEKHPNGDFTAELEFRIRLAGGREIVEFVAGSGKSLEDAKKDAQLSFILATFHVVYRSFMNPADPHQPEEPVTINGKPRVLVFGDTMTRSGTTNTTLDIAAFRKEFRQMVSGMSLSPEPHWLKIVYGQHKGKVLACSVTLDNNENDVLTEKVKQMAWPVRDDFYMVKQFMVVK